MSIDSDPPVPFVSIDPPPILIDRNRSEAGAGAATGAAVVVWMMTGGGAAGVWAGWLSQPRNETSDATTRIDLEPPTGECVLADLSGTSSIFGRTRMKAHFTEI